jgi:phospholipid-binding lipoprotein MlaA
MVAAAALLLSVAGCATPPDDPEERAAFEAANDPLEPMNRYFFEVNYALDELLFKPIAGWYWLALPDFAHDTVSNVLDNLDAPAVLVNDLLQGEWDRARITATRFAVNTTFGIAGLFDVAKGWGYPGHTEDLGQTLGVWGVPEGPYLVVPILGPSSVRDASTRVADSYMDPFSYLEGPLGLSYIFTYRYVARGLEERSRNLTTLDAIREGSLDYYATLRSIYRQNREYEVNNGRQTAEPAPATAADPGTPAQQAEPDLNSTLAY